MRRGFTLIDILVGVAVAVSLAWIIAVTDRPKPATPPAPVHACPPKIGETPKQKTVTPKPVTLRANPAEMIGHSDGRGGYPNYAQLIEFYGCWFVVLHDYDGRILAPVHHPACPQCRTHRVGGPSVDLGSTVVEKPYEPPVSAGKLPPKE